MVSSGRSRSAAQGVEKCGNRLVFSVPHKGNVPLGSQRSSVPPARTRPRDREADIAAHPPKPGGGMRFGHPEKKPRQQRAIAHS